MDRKKCLLLAIVAVVMGLMCLVVLDMAFMDKAAAQAEPPKEIVGKDGAKMVLIPAGEFEMGTDPGEIPGLVQWLKELNPNLDVKAEWFEDESPRHTVYLDAFYMDKYEVTNAQYRQFMDATGHREPEGHGIVIDEGGSYKVKPGFKPWSDKDYNGDDQPVVCVTWEDARAYAEWAGKQLPTEAEWEKAARGGLVGKRFLWGDDLLPKAGNFPDETLKKTFPYASLFIPGYDDGYTYPAPVGSFAPNGYGLYDMAGNVWEWCADRYNKGYYTNSPGQNPKGSDSGRFRVMRGGSWDSLPLTLRVADRYSSDPAGTFSSIGFRCVASVRTDVTH